MDTATETPPAEEQKTPEVAKPEVQGLASVGASLLKAVRVQSKSAGIAAPDPIKEEIREKPEEATPPEEPKETPPEKPAEPPKEKPVEPEVKPATRANFERLETKAKEAQKLAETVTKERDELRTQIQQLQEQVKRVPDEKEFATQLQQRDEVIAQLKAQLRGTSIERDPDFIEKYDKGRQRRRADLKALAMTAGATEQEFDRAIQFGDDEKLAEWREALPVKQRTTWDARTIEIEQLEYQRREALENSDKTFKQLQEQRAQQARKEFEVQTMNRLRTAESVAGDIFKGIKEGAPDFQDEELEAHVKHTLQALAGGEGAERWTEGEIMKQIGFAQILPRVVEAQKVVIEGHSTKIQEQEAAIEELTKKVSEQEEFIRSFAGGTRVETTGGKNDKTKVESLLKSIHVKVPGR